MLPQFKSDVIIVSNIHDSRTGSQVYPTDNKIKLQRFSQATMDRLDCSFRQAPQTEYAMPLTCRVFSPTGHLVLPVGIDQETDLAHYSEMEDGSLFTTVENIGVGRLTTMNVWRKEGGSATLHHIGSPWRSEMHAKIQSNYRSLHSVVDGHTQCLTDLIYQVQPLHETRYDLHKASTHDLVSKLIPLHKLDEGTLSFGKKQVTTMNVSGIPINVKVESDTDHYPDINLYLAALSSFEYIHNNAAIRNYAIGVRKDTDNHWTIPTTAEDKASLLVEVGNYDRAFLMFVNESRGVETVTVVFFTENIETLNKCDPKTKIIQVAQNHLDSHVKQIALLLAEGGQKKPEVAVMLRNSYIPFTGFGVNGGGSGEMMLRDGIKFPTWQVFVVTDSKVRNIK